MPQIKLTAGSLIETVSVSELRAELRNLMQEWKVDVARGIRPVQISADGLADTSTGRADLGGSTSLKGGTLGPNPGFWWAVTRLAVRVDDVPAPFSVYTDRRSPQQIIRDVDGSQNGYASFGNNELLIGNGSQLLVSTSPVDPTKRVFVSGLAIEIPQQLLWKWVGA